jgi:hypothetical protein
MVDPGQRPPNVAEQSDCMICATPQTLQKRAEIAKFAQRLLNERDLARRSCALGYS